MAKNKDKKDDRQEQRDERQEQRQEDRQDNKPKNNQSKNRSFRDYAVDEMRGRGRNRDKRRGRNDRRDRADRGGGNRSDIIGGGGGGGGTTTGGVNIPSNPLTGAVKDLGFSGSGIEGIVRDTPTALITNALQGRGLGLHGGAGDLLASIASPDQLDTLIALGAAGGGNPAATPGEQGNAILGFYNNLLGQGGLPSLSQLFGGAFGAGATSPDSPYYGLLTGGTPAQQLAELTSAISDMSQVAGMNPLSRRAMLSSLNAKGREYASSQGQVGANQTFVDFVRSQMPQIAGMLGAGTVAGTPPVTTTTPTASTGQATAGGGEARTKDARARSGGRDANPREVAAGRGRGIGRFSDYVDRQRGGGRGAGRSAGIGERAIAGENPKKLARQADRAAKRAGRGGGNATANADAGTVSLGDINGPVTLDVNADAGYAYDGGGTGRPARTGRNPGRTRDFQTYASQNTPYTRPMPRSDVPGFDRSAEQWTAQTRGLLDERNNAWTQANNDYQQQVSAYGDAVQQAQQAQAARQTGYGTVPSLFKQRLY